MTSIKENIRRGVLLLKKKNLVPFYETKEGDLLDGKVALIVGGSGGIGFAIAEKLHMNGCKVVIAGTSPKKSAALARKLGSDADSVVINLEEVATFPAKVREAALKFGHLDILVNSAGVHTETGGVGFLDFTEEDYDRILDINLKGCFFIGQAVAKWMINNNMGGGHILNVSSSAGNEPAWSPYRLSKWGIKGLTQGMASKLASYGITVNAIAPGTTATAMLGFEEGDSISADDNQMGRFIMPNEVAEYALLLVSDLGDMVVGDTLYISGGRGVCDVR